MPLPMALSTVLVMKAETVGTPRGLRSAMLDSLQIISIVHPISFSPYI
jgi:hypothetical protein